ncbi:hypothetical protein C5746_42895 [Streptomyces atratus]|uniref:Uncharacterized protein n=1 Tax=Streptomyces atratus TaxID=1893 RepID=A0A2Z5J5W4_STRAR|nr:hypothetical protein C5746_00340 [Streptomyces atratus]AXE82466.1 hypothetical protein C5746_42895 [Streptomyces atratus]
MPPGPAPRRTFAEHGLTDDLTFIGSGKLGLSENAAVAFALGVDVINVAREAMRRWRTPAPAQSCRFKTQFRSSLVACHSQAETGPGAEVRVGAFGQWDVGAEFAAVHGESAGISRDRVEVLDDALDFGLPCRPGLQHRFGFVVVAPDIDDQVFLPVGHLLEVVLPEELAVLLVKVEDPQRQAVSGAA